MDALSGVSAAHVWLRVDTYHNPGSPVRIHVDDNGPGVVTSRDRVRWTPCLQML